MQTTLLLIVVPALLLAGCATPFRAPPDLAHIVLERGDSPLVHVEKIWLARSHGPLLVRGYVVRRRDATDTTPTHLDVSLYDARGGVLRTSVAHFEPRQIPRRRRLPAAASYAVQLDPLPAGVARIAVIAHEGPHP